MKVKIKKLHPDAVVPSYAHSTDCGLDLTAVSKTFDEYGNVVYGFGLAFEIPEGYAGFIFPRSSNHKSGLLLTNSVGILDSCYRGEVTAKFASRTKLSRPTKFWEKLKLLFGSNPEGRNMAVTTNEVWDKDINYNIGVRRHWNRSLSRCRAIRSPSSFRAFGRCKRLSRSRPPPRQPW